MLLGIIVAVAGSLAGPLLLAQSAPPPGSTARYLFERLNSERARSGLPLLAWDERLYDAARRHSEEMAEHGELSHQLGSEPHLQQRLAETRLDRSAENVGYAPDAASLHRGLMDSALHRQNILDPRFNAVGIGIARDTQSIWATQDFAHIIPTMDAQSAAEQAAVAFLRIRAEVREFPLRRLKTSQLEQVACAMGEDGHPDAKAVLRATNGRRGLAYSTSDPRRLPETAEEVARTRDVDSYAIGACFARSQRYPNGMYWVALAVLRTGVGRP